MLYCAATVPRMHWDSNCSALFRMPSRCCPGRVSRASATLTVFPSWLGKNSSTGKNVRLLDEFRSHMAASKNTPSPSLVCHLPGTTSLIPSGFGEKRNDDAITRCVWRNDDAITQCLWCNDDAITQCVWRRDAITQCVWRNDYAITQRVWRNDDANTQCVWRNDDATALNHVVMSPSHNDDATARWDLITQWCEVYRRG